MMMHLGFEGGGGDDDITSLLLHVPCCCMMFKEFIKYIYTYIYSESNENMRTLS